MRAMPERPDAVAQARVSALVRQHHRSLLQGRPALVRDARGRAGRRPARARDLHAPARLARPGDRARLAARRRQARGDGDPQPPGGPDPRRSTSTRTSARPPISARSTSYSPAASASAARRRRSVASSRTRRRRSCSRRKGCRTPRSASRLQWTYTKVNRCITEGRARFLKIYAELEAGEACERFAPTLASLAAGTADADAMLELRPHLRNCPACRATVRDLHATRVGRLRVLWPIPALIAPLRWLGLGRGEPASRCRCRSRRTATSSPRPAPGPGRPRTGRSVQAPRRRRAHRPRFVRRRHR